MAPVSASSAGVARQAMDDLDLVALVKRLSTYDPTTTTSATATSATTTVATGTTAAGGKEESGDDDDAAMADADAAEDNNVVNNDGGGGEQTPPSSSSSPPRVDIIDIDGLVAELERYPRWRFQEQADLYEWIRPLNAIDAALEKLLDDHPKLLLIPREKVEKQAQLERQHRKRQDAKKEDKEGAKDESKEEEGAKEEEAVKEAKEEQTKAKSKEASDNDDDSVAVRSLSIILTFLSTLLRNSTSKNLFPSLSPLSDLLASRHDTLASLAIDTLASLAAPPALHRQQAPEANHHSAGSGGHGGGSGANCTMLHNPPRSMGGNDAEVLRRLVGAARGWGSSGSGLGLGRCVTADDAELFGGLDDKEEVANRGGENDDKMEIDGEAAAEEGKPRGKTTRGGDYRASFARRAGEISFECYCQPQDGDGDDNSNDNGRGKGGSKKSALVSIHLTKEDMMLESKPSRSSSSSPSAMSTTSEDNDDDEGEPRQRAEKKRRRMVGKDAQGDGEGDGDGGPRMKSTARLYSECLAKIGERYRQQTRGTSAAASNDDVPPTPSDDDARLLTRQQRYDLLASVRLARSFRSPPSRAAAVDSRLRALAAVVNAHPSREAVSSHLAAQPELAGELAELLGPTVSGGTGVLAGEGDAAGDDDDDDDDGEGGEGGENNDGTGRRRRRRRKGPSPILALADSPRIPYRTRTLAVEALTALVARRDASSVGAAQSSGVARQAGVLAELGVGRGQGHLGLLPALVRHSLAALNSHLLHDGEEGGEDDDDDDKEEAEGEEGEQGANNAADDDLGEVPPSPEDMGLRLGLAFLRATRPPPPPRHEREERALEFVDSVLTLTSAVVSVPSGTASLTDCGIVPALVAAVALDSASGRRRLAAERRRVERWRRERRERRGTDDDDDRDGPDEEEARFLRESLKESYSDCLLKFISAQAIQILEGAIVTHGGALSAFHELRGVDVLVRRLEVEVERVRLQSGVVAAGPPSTASSERQGGGDGADGAMAAGDGGSGPSAVEILLGDAPAPAAAAVLVPDPPRPRRRTLQAAQRVLLFSAVNCLTVVFHQHDAGASSPGTAAPSGSAQLRRPGLRDVLLEIMDGVGSYGGVLAALAATFLSDVMNADPRAVHHVHESGLAGSFLRLLGGRPGEGGDDGDGAAATSIEPSAELIMAVPNVLMALSLTEAGARAVAEADPFPALLSCFVSPRHAMPQSRCLLSEMAAIVGTGLDELMRHNPGLRTTVLRAVVGAVNGAVSLGRDLVALEDDAGVVAEAGAAAPPAEYGLEARRTHLMQHSYNLAQLLEQLLHNEDHVGAFVAAGGFDALLDLARWGVAPGGRGPVAHASCLSSPIAAGVAQSSASGTLAALVKIVASHSSEPDKLLKKVTSHLESQLTFHSSCIGALKAGSSDLACDGVLGNVPPVALPDLDESHPRNRQMVRSLGRLFRSALHVDWLTSALSMTIRAACQRHGELGGAGLAGTAGREWKKVVSSPPFESLIDRLSLLNRSSMREVCRVRTEPGFDERDERLRGEKPDKPLVYRIRIVCQEGAIVRNGIEIDGCDSLGGLEMGEIAEAYDRCINSSGVLRYRTTRGWVSELTRGAGRENITEVLDVRIAGAGETPPPIAGEVKRSRRIECGVPDLRSAGASILVRLHSSHSNLFASLARMMASGLRPSPLRSSFQPPSPAGQHSVAAAKLLGSNLVSNLSYPNEWDEDGGESMDDGDAGDLMARDAAKCMYLGSQLNLLYASLFEEKRDRCACNIALLINLLACDGWTDGLYPTPESDGEKNDESTIPQGRGTLLSAIRFILMHGLRDMALFAANGRTSRGKPERECKPRDESGFHRQNPQRMSRAVASSLPPTLSLLRRLVSRTLLVESQMTTSLAKMKVEDFFSLVPNMPKRENSSPQFNPAQFARALHLELARLSCEVWSDKRFACMPSHIVHPWISHYMAEVIRSLEEAGKVVVAEPPPPSAAERLLGMGGRLRDPNSRGGRILASMGLLRNPPPEAGEQRGPPEPFEPSDESISRLAEMGFARDHAVEALETVGTNRVEVAMEYALTHPPSSPATLERRRAARERRRLEQQQRREEAERQSSVNEERPGQGDAASNNEDEVENQSSNSKAPDTDEAATEPKSLTEDELKAKREKEAEEKSASEAREYLKSLKDSLCKICLDIIEGSLTCDTNSAEDKAENSLEVGDNLDEGMEGDSQGVVKVVSNFLLDIVRSYPDLEAAIASDLLQRLKAKLDVKSPSHCRVKSDGTEHTFAALMHASIIIFRALPKSRPLVLRLGLVGMITHCVRNCTLTSALRGGKDSGESPMAWPRWLAPSLLMLEIMAQPTSVALDGEEVGLAKPTNRKSEYGKVLAEHKKQTSILVKTTKSVYLAVTNKEAGKTRPKKRKDTESSKKQGDRKTDDTPSTVEEVKHKSNGSPPPLPPIPAFLPLLHSETSEACMLLCLQLLGLKTKRGLIDLAHVEKVCPPPIICQAILALLVRLIRSRQLASSCLQMGGADLILALPGRSRFPGNGGIITLLLRRMLEDEATLHTMMETEIRSVVAKLYKKQHPSHPSTSQPKVNLKSFMQSCTPLICRDPAVFLKAIASTVKIDHTGSESSSLVSSRGSQVSILSNEERARNAKLLSSHFATGSNSDSSAAERRSSQEETPKRGRGRSKSPHRASLTKKLTPQKSGSCEAVKYHCQLNGSPSNHVTSLLLGCVMTQDLDSDSLGQPFLSLLDHLVTLSDLVLAVPACGAAIHRFKPAKGLTIHNAIPGCPNPPQTAVSYFLHQLLPQPRQAPKQELLILKEDDVDVKSQKMQAAYDKTKTSQATARMMICLVARSGEGRRRVISDLVFALSCGQFQLEKKPLNFDPLDSSQRVSIDEDAKMWSLKSWGELCMGLSAPRSSSSGLTSSDLNSSLSFEVVKLFLQHGATHALMAAIESISLHHPMASSVASALIRPLEVFTRGSVYKTVHDMAQKEKAKLEEVKTNKESRRVTFGPSQRSENSFIDDDAIENAFEVSHNLDGSMESSDEDDLDSDDESMDGDSSDDNEIEVPPIDYSDNDSDNGPSDEEIFSSDSSDEGDPSDDESDGESIDEDADDDDIDLGSDEDEEEDAEGDDDDMDLFEDYEGDAQDEPNVLEEVAAGGNEVDDGMEGWTRVDAGRDGGRGLGSLLDLVQQSHGNGGQHRVANGGFSIDNVETMLGNVLRGDMEGLAELEDSLGIRVVRGDSRGGLGAGHINRSSFGGPVGNNTRPALVHQSSHNGSSIFGSRGLVEFSPMEFVFGGPATGGGNQSYDSPFEASADGLGREIDSPSSYELFHGGVISTHSGASQPSLHPLVQSIQLPPMTSLRASLSSRAPQDTSRTIAASGSFIASANGNIRVNDRLQVHESSGHLGTRRSALGSLAGFTDDGLAPDRATEEFSVAFGQALDSFLQDQSRPQVQPACDSNIPPNRDSSNEAEGHATSSTEIESQAPNENMEELDSSRQNVEDESPPSQDAQSEAAEVSSAMAAGLTISQPGTDNANLPTSNDQANMRGTSVDNAEATDDAVMAGVRPESAGEHAEEDNDGNSEDGAPQEDVEPNNEEISGEDAEENAGEAEDGVDEGVDEGAEEGAEDEMPEQANAEEVNENDDDGAPAPNELVCPPDIDPEVFASLPLEMQQEIAQQHEVVSGSGLDPEALAALPEDMRREVIEQEQEQQRLREQQATQSPADPANAEDMDNASFLASLAPDLRQEILLTADEAFISSLPPTIIAEANVLRERVHRRRAEETANASNNAGSGVAGTRPGSAVGARPAPPAEGNAAAARGRRQRNGKLRVEPDREEIVYPPNGAEHFGPFLTPLSAKALLSLLYLLTPVQPQRTIHKLVLNLCQTEKSRDFILNAILGLLSNDKVNVLGLLEKLNPDSKDHESDQSGFPPSALIGVTVDLMLDDDTSRLGLGFRRRQGSNSPSAVTVAASLPATARGSSHDGSIPPVISRRLLGLCTSLCKSSPRVAFSMLCNAEDAEKQPSCMEKLIDLIENDHYSQSATSLDQLLSLLEIVVAPLSLLPKDDQDVVDDLQGMGDKEWVKVPRVVVSKPRLHLLIHALRFESCKDSSFLKINTLTRRLSRIQENRESILHELALVAQGLGKAAILDLKTVSVRLSSAAKCHQRKLLRNGTGIAIQALDSSSEDDLVAGTPSNSVALSTSRSELKLLRVLQMLTSLCDQDEEPKTDGNTPEFVSLLQSLDFEPLWDQLTVCLKTVSVLEGIKDDIAIEENEGDEDEHDNNEENPNGKDGKKLQNSVAGLITRFLPAIESFFLLNASDNAQEGENAKDSRIVRFAATNKILLNALLRSNPSLLEKGGLKAMVKMPQCRLFLDFDVKRQWFKTQVRRLRQQASRRHGSFRLNLRRRHVFEDSFHAFIHRNADELRGRLHITFANEEGVDAGGLSREFFAILAKEMFNPNYALFMSTEDGCTFQPNPNSGINPDDMRYFRFVGRIVGKAVVDGFLLDAHFTRSLYQHMLGVKPRVDDMQAIDPDYYKNLQMILEHNLEDIGLELTFSTEDHSFGRSQTIDLIPNGRTILVTEETKQRYVDLVCQHRMTTAIEKQIKAFLSGFHEMVDPELISIFTAKELELLISGMPDIDIHDLKNNTDYNGYRPADAQIGWFWNIMFALSRSEKAAFLQFVTGSSKVPLAGFSELQGMRGVQKFSINKASGPAGALMSAHTCFNALDLPVYSSEEEMKGKLLYAISEGSGGFGFA